MPNNYFAFKEFVVRQDQCAMKVGTDGVLLGAWAGVTGVSGILDIGTGTGLIALMMAQKSGARIEAVEIGKNAYLQAMDNVSASPWKDRIRVVHSSFQDYCLQPHEPFDLIITNPPFFTGSLKAPNQERNMARHNDLLPAEEMLKGVSGLLTEQGKFAVILPYVDSQLFVVDAALHGLYCVRRTSVRPKASKKAHRVLMEFSRIRAKVEEDELVIHDGDGYSVRYKELTGDFYLTGNNSSGRS